MLLSEIHTLAIIVLVSGGRGCSTVEVSTRREVFVEYCSVENTSHILVHAVLIKDWKCLCASVIPSMLSN